VPPASRITHRIIVCALVAAIVLSAAVPAAAQTPARTPTVQTYTVVSGDTLSRIAARYGVTVQAIAAANGIADPSRIRVGQVLIIPAAATPTRTPTRLPMPPLSNLTAARAVEVVDGDTIKVSISGTVYTVRYIGMDTPETVHPSKPVEFMGPEASAANRGLVSGQTVYLEKDVSETDRYGRLLRYVWLANGILVNEELCRLGFAQVSTYPPDVKYQDRFLAAVREAREAERGLWGPGPVTPAAASAPTATPTRVQAPPTPRPTAVPTARTCCRVCTTGKACGNSCINVNYTCRQPPGCACNAR
jgi:micrococcal nuclease